MSRIVQALQDIGRAANANDAAKTQAAITGVRNILKEDKSPTVDLKQLDQELSTWQAKLSVILQEPVGRQGLIQHTHHWIQKLS